MQALRASGAFRLKNTQSFLQSPEWEIFQNSLGRQTWRADGVLIIEHNFLGFNYIYCPRPNDFSFLDGAEKIAKQESSIFLKIDPGGSLNIPEFKNLKFKVSNSLQPQETLMLDLKKTGTALLEDMHEKTRYNIRLAERKNVYVIHRVVPSDKELEKFWNLLCDTARRDGFHTHQKVHYEKLFSTRSAKFSNELVWAEHAGSILAAAVVNFYIPSGTATYLHGASSREQKQVMAPYLLHWGIMMEAKRRGLGFYDFGGVDENRWPGVTRFKSGFGGTLMGFPFSTDVVYRSGLYFLYQLTKKIKNR